MLFQLIQAIMGSGPQTDKEIASHNLAVAMRGECHVISRSYADIIRQQAIANNTAIRIIDTNHPTHVMVKSGRWCPTHQQYHF